MSLAVTYPVRKKVTTSLRVVAALTSIVDSIGIGKILEHSSKILGAAISIDANKICKQASDMRCGHGSTRHETIRLSSRFEFSSSLYGIMKALTVSLVFEVETMKTPGAKISTTLPKLEKSAMVSFMSDAPTVMAARTRAGETFSASIASFPAATTT